MKRSPLSRISLDALRVFDAVARCGSFTAAASELHVTQVAVSKRISGLEDQLGYDLFLRHGRQIQLTSKGSKLAARVNAALHYLESELEALSPGSESGHVSISAAASISQLWLQHELHHLSESDPELKLVLNTTDRIRDLEETPDELSVLYLGAPDHPGWSLVPLFAEELVPVATWDYLHSKGIKAADLPLSAERIATLDGLDYRRANAHWYNLSMWYAQHLATEAPKMKLTYSSYSMTIDAALDHRGIALGSRHMLGRLIKSGKLVELSDQVHVTGNSYYLGLAQNRPVSEAALKVFTALSGTGEG